MKRKKLLSKIGFSMAATIPAQLYTVKFTGGLFFMAFLVVAFLLIYFNAELE